MVENSLLLAAEIALLIAFLVVIVQTAHNKDKGPTITVILVKVLVKIRGKNIFCIVLVISCNKGKSYKSLGLGLRLIYMRNDTFYDSH